MTRTIQLAATVAALLAAPLRGNGQGSVSFGNTPITRITNALTGQPIFGTNTFRFGLYVGPPGSSVEQFALLALTVNLPSASATSPSAGGFLGGEIVVPGGDDFHPVEVQIRGWSFSAGESYEAAYAAARPNDPSVLLGGSEVLLVWPSVGPGPPVELFRPFGPLNGFTVGLIPEPSAFALALLGTGVLLGCLRRKDSRPKVQKPKATPSVSARVWPA